MVTEVTTYQFGGDGGLQNRPPPHFPSALTGIPPIEEGNVTDVAVPVYPVIVTSPLFTEYS